MDPQRLAYIQEVCNQIKGVSQTVGNTIKDIGYVTKHQAIPPAKIIPSSPPGERNATTRDLYMIDESVRSLVDDLSAAQMRVAQLERELLEAKLALADRDSTRARPALPKPAVKVHTAVLDNYTDKLFEMHDELSDMIQTTSNAIVVFRNNETQRH